MYDVISEVIAFEKQAKQIVENANLEKERILSDANKKTEEEYQLFQKDKNSAIENLHGKYAEMSKAHIEDTIVDKNEQIMRLNKVFEKNSETWLEEIYGKIIDL